MRLEGYPKIDLDFIVNLGQQKRRSFDFEIFQQEDKIPANDGLFVFLLEDCFK
jgi:hypothetical protein